MVSRNIPRFQSQGPRIDLFVGWRYLFSRNFRNIVHKRWRKQHFLINALEAVTGATTIVATLYIVTLVVVVLKS